MKGVHYRTRRRPRGTRLETFGCSESVGLRQGGRHVWGGMRAVQQGWYLPLETAEAKKPGDTHQPIKHIAPTAAPMKMPRSEATRQNYCVRCCKCSENHRNSSSLAPERLLCQSAAGALVRGGGRAYICLCFGPVSRGNGVVWAEPGLESGRVTGFCVVALLRSCGKEPAGGRRKAWSFLQFQRQQFTCTSGRASM